MLGSIAIVAMCGLTTALNDVLITLNVTYFSGPICVIIDIFVHHFTSDVYCCYHPQRHLLFKLNLSHLYDH